MWISVSEQLPEDDQRVLRPSSNKLFLPGETLNLSELLCCASQDFYAKNEEKRAKHGLHFWAGEETTATSLQTLRIGVPFRRATRIKRARSVTHAP